MQVRAGALAERVATEGVMLQYAVDTKLDLCLSNIYEAVTKPPLPLNPYPRLLHILRAHAAKLDLFQVKAVGAQDCQPVSDTACKVLDVEGDADVLPTMEQ